MPIITLVIMIGCINLDAVDLAALSPDGMLNTVDCVLTSEFVRAPFEDPLQKVKAHDEIYALI